MTGLEQFGNFLVIKPFHATGHFLYLLKTPDDDIFTAFWCLYGSDYIYLLQRMHFIKYTKLRRTKLTIKKQERCQWMSFWSLYGQRYLYAALHLA